MRLFVVASVLIGLALFAACESRSPYSQAQLDSVRVVTPDQVAYQPLNPARGDASPQAGVLWGDIREDEPSGVLLRFAEGFSSPPHIHNITYRAIVISGEIHNDDPDAANMWMGPGTFWTQPAGEVHITSARPGSGGTAFLEILEGPYLVQPGDLAFDNGERPLNLIHSNMVWMTPSEFNWVRPRELAARVALLWGDLEPGSLSGSLIGLPPGFDGTISTQGDALKAVTVQGEITHTVSGSQSEASLPPGGYFASDEAIAHSVSCVGEAECLIYIRTAGSFRVD